VQYLPIFSQEVVQEPIERLEAVQAEVVEFSNVQT